MTLTYGLAARHGNHLFGFSWWAWIPDLRLDRHGTYIRFGLGWLCFWATVYWWRNK